MFDVRQRDVPEQLVLTEQRNLRAAELTGWLRAAMRRLAKTAQEHGGVAGSWFVVYHGQMTDDGEVPIEVCAPIGFAHEGSIAAAARHEPPHREAYVTVTKAQLESPQIQTAYAAVEEWIRSRRLEISDSPREVYFTDVSSAGPADEVCDIAFPIR